jgi:hypothetical protein
VVGVEVAAQTLTSIGAALAAVVALQADVAATVVVVSFCAGAHRGGEGSEGGGRAGQTLAAVGAGQTSVVAFQAQFVHEVVEVANGTDTVLAGNVEGALIGAVAVIALALLQTGGAGVMALWTGYGGVVVVVMLGTAAPV